MEAAESALHDVVEKVRSWIPRGSPSHAMSRDYWMRDSSCSVCYECDCHFSLFNRRHHCRICGRIFCGKCTQNTLPTTDECTRLQEEGERVRVCKFCFNTREQNLSSPNGRQNSTPILTPSSSRHSLASNSTSGGSSTASSVYPGPGLMGSSFRANLANTVDAVSDKKQLRMIGLGSTSDRSVSPRGREGSPSPYDFCNKSRSDDADGDSDRATEFNDPRLQQMQTHNKQDEEKGSGSVDMDNPGSTYTHTLPSESGSYCKESVMKARADYHNKGKEDKSVSSLANEIGLQSVSKRSGTSLEYFEGAEEVADDNNSFYAPLYREPSIHEKEPPLDVENNTSLWVAPPPEDGEDEMGISIGDDDDYDMEGAWAFSHSSGNWSCNEYRNREKTSSEEQRNAMRRVVDGHFRVLVAQLLSGEGIQAEDGGRESWLEIVTALSLHAASFVKPDTSGGGGMDPGGYVKVKCVATGLRSESCVVKGIIFKKNVAHRRMTLRYENPKLLLLGGALEYQRVSNHFSSLDTLLHQEPDHLSMAVSRIEAHHPNVLLVENTVARQAQEWLLAKEISFVLNVKRHLLERIAKFTGASIVSNLDHLTSMTSTKAGHCELFHVEKYVEEHGSAGQSGKRLQKTLMFFEGCPKPWGCTILLKGSNGDELKKVKRAVQFAVFAAHHLALETSFLADEGAKLPELCLKSPLSVALPDKQSNSDRSISTVSGFSVSSSSQSEAGNKAQVCAFSLANTAVSPHSNSMLNLDSSGLKGNSSAASVPSSVTSSHVFSTASSPSICPLRMQETMLTDADIKTSTSGASFKFHDLIGTSIGKLSPDMTLEDFEQGISGLSASLRKGYLGTVSTPSPKFSAPDNPVSIRENKSICVSEACSKSPPQGSCDFPSSIEDHTVDRQLERMNSDCRSLDLHHDLRISTHDGESQDFIHEEFPPSPSDHQSIVVSLLSSCLRKRTICERGHLFRIKYYGTFDKPLGRFLRDTVFDPTYKCQSCGEPKCAHVDCYTHPQGSLTISVHRQCEVLPGESEGKIWMWHRCLKCPRIDGVPRATHRLVMSDAAWGLSFGKFLELSFSNHAAASRVASCGHSLHRDCLRFYGFGDMVACFRYSPVNVCSVRLSPSKLEFNYSEQQDWLQQEIYEVAEKGENFFKKLSYNLHQIEERIARDGSGKVPEVKRQISDMQDLLLKQENRFKAALQTASQPHADILELNCIRRVLSICSSLWDDRIQGLLCSLKSPKSTFGFDSIAFGDSFVSFLKDISFGSGKNSKPGNEVTTLMDGNLFCSNLEHVQGTSRPAHVGTTRPIDIVQTEKLKPRHTTGSVPDVEATAKMHNDSALVDGSAVSSFVDTSLNNGSIDEDLSKECPTTFQKDRLMEANSDSERVTFSDIGAEDRSSTSSSFSGSSIWPSRGTSTASSKFLEGEVGADQNFTEGYFSAFRDLSATFEAAWTGKGQIVEAHGVDIATNGQEISTCNAGTEIMATSDGLVCGSKGSGSEGSDESLTDYHIPKISLRSCLSSQESWALGADSQLASTLTSPAKSGEPSDIEGWVGFPFSSLYDNAQSLLTGSSPKADVQILLRSPFVVMPHADQVMARKGVRISLPVGINDTIVTVYDDEPTSIIAYAITSQEHQAHLSKKSVDKDKQKDKDREQKERDKERAMLDHYRPEGVVSHPLQPVDGSSENGDSSLKDKSSNLEDSILASSSDQSFEDPLIFSKSMHIKISFTDDTSQGKIKYTVTCYNAKQFAGLRKKCCPNEMDFIRSLCRCKKWGAQGGKSNVFFAKTADDRFVVKQVTKTELESFLSFAPAYFKYISDALNSGSPTCLSKILGIYQVMVKHGKVGKEVRMDLMLMENLLYGRQLTRIYDLKGSVRSRYNADATGKNAVLLDQNLLESMQTNPIFISNKAKRMLERAVWNDTAFLASVYVMDYSLLVGIDEERRDLVLGIIDFMRQYTWDKHLETWVKASGILGGPKNAPPTVISPKEYKKRFRNAMKTYFLMVPDQWSPPAVVSGPPQIGATNEGRFIATKHGATHDSDSEV